MLATPGQLPAGSEWVFQVKFDGIRLLAEQRGRDLRLLSRGGLDLTDRFPELRPLAAALADAGHDQVVLDGELVADHPGTVPTLQALAGRIQRVRPGGPATPVRFHAFDVLAADGTDVTARPYAERRDLLERVLPGDGCWSLVADFDDGAALLAATAEQGFEGVIAKRRDSPYRPGRRSSDWVKVVHRDTADFVIVGWRPEPSRSRIGSLVVAEATGTGLRAVGRVGSGLTQAVSDALAPVLADLARPTAAVPVPGDARTRWCRPVLVVEVVHAGFTRDRQLRHPVLVRLRPDRIAADLLAEAAS